MSMTSQQKHDLLMEMRPDDASHDEAICMFCTVKASEEETVAEDQKNAIFTQEQHEQLLASAVEKASTEARATADAEVLSLNEQLTAAQGAVTAAEELAESLKAEIAARDEATKLAELEGERVAAVKAVATFSDEQIENRKEAWAKMDEDAFAAYIEDIKAVATAAVSKDDGKAADSKFDQTRQTASDKSDDESVLKSFFSSDLSVAQQS